MRGAVRWLREAWWFLGQNRRRLVILSALATVCSTTGLIPIWFLGQMVELVSKQGSTQAIGAYSLTMVALLLTIHSVRIWAKREASVLQADLCASVRENALDQLLTQGVREGRLVGNEVSRLESGLRDFSELYRIVQNDLLFSTVNLIACCVLFFVSDRVLLLGTFIYVGLVVALLYYVIPRIGRAQSEISKARETFSGLFTDVVGSALSVRAEGVEELMAGRVGVSARQVERFERERVRLGAMQWRMFNYLNATFYGVVLFRLASQAASGGIEVSLLVVSFGYVREFVGATLRMFEIAEGFVQSAVGFTRMLHLLADRDEIFERPREVPERWETLRLDRVSHRYPGMSTDVLNGVTFTLRRNSRVSIAGSSGAGKSTLVKILLGLLAPDKGAVTLDGHPLEEYSLRSLRGSMAIALQECELLAFSLRDNITMLRRVQEDWLQQVLRVCGLGPVVARLPQGLETPVGEQGYRLSGGERQRVALARALVRRPSLLIVDEATSMLDGGTERAFFEGLRHALPELTLIIISHHERTQSYVGETYRLENGVLTGAPDQPGENPKG